MCTGHELVKHGASPLKSVWHITAPKNLVDLSISRNSTVFILICITLYLKLSTFLCHVPACVTKQSRNLVGWEKRYTTLTCREHYNYFKKESASTKWTPCITVYIKTNPFVGTTEMEITSISKTLQRKEDCDSVQRYYFYGVCMNITIYLVVNTV